VLRQVIGGRIEPSQALHWGLLRRDPPGGVAGDAGAERKLLAALLAPAVPVAALLAPAVGVGPA
jgi:hypothetical protein